MRVQVAMAGESGGHYHFGTWLKEYWPHLTVGGAGVWAVVKQLFTERRLSAKDKTDMATIAQDAVRDAVQILRDENSRLSGRVEELEDEIREAKESFAATLLSKDGEISLLRGELRGMLATALSYQAKLETAGVPHEKISPHYWDISGFEIKKVEVKT